MGYRTRKHKAFWTIRWDGVRVHVWCMAVWIEFVFGRLCLMNDQVFWLAQVDRVVLIGQSARKAITSTHGETSGHSCLSVTVLELVNCFSRIAIVVLSRTPMPKPMQLFVRLKNKMVDFGIRQFLFGQTGQICFTTHCCSYQLYLFSFSLIKYCHKLVKGLRHKKKGYKSTSS